jgi:hypothetical protein
MKVGDLVCISNKSLLKHLENAVGVIISSKHTNTDAYNTSDYARSIAQLREQKWKVYFSNNSLVELYGWELQDVESKAAAG